MRCLNTYCAVQTIYGIILSVAGSIMLLLYVFMRLDLLAGHLCVRGWLTEIPYIYHVARRLEW